MNNLVIGKIEFGRSPKSPDKFISVDHVINDAVSLRMWKALQVIQLNPKIKSFLEENDPKALRQVTDAIEEYETSYQQSDIDNL